MPLKLRLYLAGGAIAATLAFGGYIYHAGGERALLEARLHASDSTIAMLSRRAAQTDIVYKRDTIYLRGARLRYDSIITRWETTTVSVPPETVRVIVAEGAKAFNACTTVVLTCEQRVAQRDSIIADLRKQRPLLVNAKACRIGCISKRVATAGIVGGLGYIAGRESRH